MERCGGNNAVRVMSRRPHHHGTTRAIADGADRVALYFRLSTEELQPSSDVANDGVRRKLSSKPEQFRRFCIVDEHLRGVQQRRASGATIEIGLHNIIAAAASRRAMACNC